EDGTKLVIFGGRYYDKWNQGILGHLFILDLTTMVWTRAQDYATPRTYAACAIADDTFISWGGTDTSTTVNAPVIIYDLKRNKYLSQFKGPDPDKDVDPRMKDAPPPKTTGSGGEGGIRGGIGGGGSSSSSDGMTYEEHRNLVLG
ncbi:hypothetical protein BGZ95_008435, partial [Linnemannia exigua]